MEAPQPPSSSRPPSRYTTGWPEASFITPAEAWFAKAPSGRPVFDVQVFDVTATADDATETGTAPDDGWVGVDSSLHAIVARLPRASRTERGSGRSMGTPGVGAERRAKLTRPLSSTCQALVRSRLAPPRSSARLLARPPSPPTQPGARTATPATAAPPAGAPAAAPRPAPPARSAPASCSGSSARPTPLPAPPAAAGAARTRRTRRPCRAGRGDTAPAPAYPRSRATP